MAKKKENKKKDDETEVLVEHIKSKYKKSYEAKSSYHTKWKNFEKAYDGSLFFQNLPEYKTQEISNFIFSTIETIKPMMLSNYPKPVVVPSIPEAFDKSKIVQNAVDFEWKRADMFTKMLDMGHNGLVYGTSCFGLFWNGNASNGLGEVECKIISPFNIFPSPSATHEDNAEYIIYATYKSYDELVEAYPDKKAELLMDIESSLDDNLSTDRISSDIRNNILYLECYHRDYATIELEETDDEGNKFKSIKRKYPKGRRTIIAGDTLLDDGENPYKDGRFPFIFWRCYPLPNSFWGIGEVESLVSPQESICKISNAIIENAELMGNPIWIMDKNCGIEKNSITNRKGLVLRKTPGTEVRRDVPPSIPVYVTNMLEKLYNDMENISGVYDVLRGNRVGSVTASSAIQSLNEQAQGRIKLKVQKLEAMISELGGMWLSRIQQFWETKRTLRVMSDHADPNTVSIQMGKDFYNYYDVSKEDIDGDYDIEVVAGSTMQQNKSAIVDRLLQLANTQAEDGLPMVDRKTVLENAELEDVMSILQRFDTIKQEMSQQNGGQAQAQVEAQMELQREKLAYERERDDKNAMIEKNRIQYEKDHELKMLETKSQSEMMKELAKIASQAELQRLTNSLKGKGED